MTRSCLLISINFSFHSPPRHIYILMCFKWKEVDWVFRYINFFFTPIFQFYFFSVLLELNSRHRCCFSPRRSSYRNLVWISIMILTLCLLARELEWVEEIQKSLLIDSTLLFHHLKWLMDLLFTVRARRTILSWARSAMSVWIARKEKY